MLVSSVIALLCVALIAYPTPCESLKCYECSGKKSCGQRQTDHIVDCAGKCVSYLNEDGNGTIVRRCCSDNCNIDNGYKAYFCSEDKCNGIHSDRKLLAMKNKISKKRIILRRTAEEESPLLNCYDCSAHNPDCGVNEATIVQGCRACLVYQNVNDNNNVIRRCCTSGCGTPGTIGDYEGRTAYSCSSNLCNEIGSEKVLTGEAELESTMTTLPATSMTTTATSTTTTTTVQTSFQCYDCSGSNEQQCTTTTSNCPMCMIYRSDNDPTKFDRRCCWWNCGTPNQVTDFNGRPTYFCNADKCNGPGSEAVLGYITTTSTTTVSSTTTQTQQTSFQCYDCSGSNEQQCTTTTSNCPMCMVYRSDNDPTKFDRRCCWWNCGTPNQVTDFNGRPTYFCNADKCNGPGSEAILGYVTTTSTTTVSSTTTQTQQTSFQCYDCSGSNEQQCTTTANCPMCTIYRSDNDPTKFDRRCCWWNCGTPNQVTDFNGRPTYFCNADKCNGPGSEAILGYVTTTSTATVPSSITTSTIATTQQTSFQCYDCSGSDCDNEDSSLRTNCLSCTLSRNPDDQTQIVRRCCWWWGCGVSNTVSMQDGIETYYCTGDKCNGYGAESVLSPPVTTTTTASTMTASMTISSQMTTTTSSSSSCTLNCQNGGTPETEDGCFCYCLEYTNGSQCENVDCAQPDVDSETCSSENQSLCDESESFAFECHHLCGKC